MTAKLCQYTKDCSFFKGEVNTDETALTIYKNVFCKRGLKGWNNCQRFLDFESQALVKNHELD